MSQVHNAISRGDLTKAITLALGVTKLEGGVERFSETVELIANLWGQPEWAFLRGEYLGAARESVGIVAGELGQIAIVNQAGSGLLIVVEAAVLRTGYVVELVPEVNIVATLLTVGTPLPRDTRGGPPTFLKPLRARILTGTSAAVFNVIIDEQTAAVPSIVLPVVLHPGWGLVLSANTLATTASGVIAWRERTAYPGEL